jgi:hypothetical protein
LLAGFASIVLPVARILNPKLGLGLFCTTTHLRFHSRKQNPPSVKAPKTSEDARSHLFLLLLLQKQWPTILARLLPPHTAAEEEVKHELREKGREEELSAPQSDGEREATVEEWKLQSKVVQEADTAIAAAAAAVNPLTAQSINHSIPHSFFSVQKLMHLLLCWSGSSSLHPALCCPSSSLRPGGGGVRAPKL